MEDYIALLKVRVIKGTNLPAKDIMSSDPYVVVRIGTQKVRSRTVKRNLNPVWDDELTLGVPNDTPKLKVELLDKDRFSKDELLGDAEVDLQPLLAVARKLAGINKETESKAIESVPASKDNALASDSHILVRKGQIVQNLHLKLNNADNGEIEIELKWIDI